jgi:plasmid stabilization system protein ParE
MKLRYAPRAHADIAHIYRYIAQHNANAATSIIRQIRSTSRLLARYPDLGRETDIPGVSRISYRPLSLSCLSRLRGDEVIIIHIRDGRRDAPGAPEL